MWKMLGGLFSSFLQIGMFSIGGGYATIPLIQEQVVKLHGWLSYGEFTDIITISQMTPGPLAVNTSTFVGLRIAGLPGAVTATVGCILTGFLISILLYRFFCRFGDNKTVSRVLDGLKAAATGLIASSAVVILLLTFYGTSDLSAVLQHVQPDWLAVLVAAGAFLLLRRRKMNPIAVMVLSGIAGICLLPFWGA